MTTNKIQEQEINDDYNAHFGGIILLSDFCTDHPGSRNIANRIASDWAFDRHCMKLSEARDRRIMEEFENE